MSRRPVIQFEPAADQLIETDEGYEVEKSLGWVKLSADFRKKMLASLKGAKLGVFICICLHLNESGESFPGVSLIAEETGYDRDTVMIAIKEMETIPNLLKVLRKKGKPNRYLPYFVARGAGNNPISLVGKSHQLIQPVGQPVQKISTTIDQTSPENLDSKENLRIKEINPISKILENASLDWSILAGENINPHTVYLAQITTEATSAFESAFGITRPWPWEGGKVQEEKPWNSFKNFIVAEYEKNKNCFSQYVTWRQGEGQFHGALSNVAIRRNPDLFSDSWDMFKLSGSQNSATPQKVKIYNPAEEPKKNYIPAPENLRFAMTQPSEYSAQLTEITDEAGRLVTEIETKEYTSREDLQRDMARVTELWQRRADLLAEMIKGVNPGYISPFGDL